jgi:hypothetical protein
MLPYACSVPKKPATKKKKRKTGRPSKLTPESQSQKAICEAATKGLSMSATAAMGGVNKDTLRNWMERGKKSSHGRYRDFLVAFTRARAEGEARLIDICCDTDCKNWRGAAFVLEKRWRAEYGTKTEAERRKLEAEADLFEAKAALARAAREKLTGTLIVELGDGAGSDDLAGGLTDEELAELIVSEMKD